MTTLGEVPPGSRVRVRGEEWAVERSMALPQGGVAVHVQGLTELVRHHKAIFVSTLDTIETLRPEATKLVGDSSPGYRRTRLFLETLLRRTPPTDAKVHIAHRAALDVMPYQLVPARQALEALRPRILLADGTGLGKTVELGILLSELAKRGRARRVLVVAIKSMLAQLQRELWARFTFPLVRLDSEGLRRVEQKIPSNRNPFSYYDRCIVSVDTLKNNSRYRAWLEHARWDVIVVDECHNVANRGSQREQLARLLAAQCDALVLTSATPHNGRPESFANLLRMLDPTAVADPQRFTREEVQHLFVRRFKKDVEGETGSSLQDRVVHYHEAHASPAEEAALAALHALDLHGLGDKREVSEKLLRWSLVKAFLSSPAAAIESLDARITKTERVLSPAEGKEPHRFHYTLSRDLTALRDARAKVAVVAAPGAFSKLRTLVEQLRTIGFTGAPASPRVVIFSERIATLDLLRDALAEAFRLSPATRDDVIGRFDARELSDVDQRKVIEDFGKESSPMRLLLASDAASEGVNLHYHCSNLIHFDIPWSLIRLTQRNGRIDRFGQKHAPNLRYLLTTTIARTADQQVARRLVEKEQEASRQLGDVGTLLGLYDPEAEEAFLLEGVAAGRSASELVPDAPLAVGVAEAQLAHDASDGESTDAPSPSPPAEAAPAGAIDLLALFDDPSDAPLPMAAVTTVPSVVAVIPDAAPPPIDLLALFAEAARAQPRSPAIGELIAPVVSLFADDFTFALATLRHLEKDPVVGTSPLAWEADERHRTLKVTAPAPFRTHREAFLPDEAVPANGTYALVASRDEIARRLRSALEGDGAWPDWHLLWEQHPLMEWLLDALAASYARHEAPVLRVHSLPPESALYVVHAQQYNYDSEPIFATWFAIEIRGAKLSDTVLSFDELSAKVGLGRELVNTGDPLTRLDALEAMIPAVIGMAREVIGVQRDKALNPLRARVRREARRVEQWETAALATIDAKRKRAAQTQRGVSPLIEKRWRLEEENVHRERANHEAGLRDLAAIGAPYVRLVAVFSAE